MVLSSEWRSVCVRARACVRECVRARARVCVRVHVCVSVCVRVFSLKGNVLTAALLSCCSGTFVPLWKLLLQCFLTETTPPLSPQVNADTSATQKPAHTGCLLQNKGQTNTSRLTACFSQKTT